MARSQTGEENVRESFLAKANERVLFESMMNHVGVRGMLPEGGKEQMDLLERELEEG
jgi:hypothetical protein